MITIFTTPKDACHFIMNFAGELKIKGNKVYNGKFQVAEFHIENNYKKKVL